MFPILIALCSFLAANITLLIITPPLVYLWKVCNGTLSAPTAPAPPQRPVNNIARSPHTPLPSSKVAPPRAGHLPSVESKLIIIRPTGYHQTSFQLHDWPFVPTLATPLHPEDNSSIDALTGLLLASICIVLGILSLSKKSSSSRPKITLNSPILRSPEPFLCVTELATDTPAHHSLSPRIGFTSLPGFEDTESIPVAKVDDLRHRMDVIEATLRRFVLPPSPSPTEPAESTTPVGTPPQKHRHRSAPSVKTEGSRIASTAPLTNSASPKIELSLHIDLSQFCSLKRNLRGPDVSPVLTPRARTLPRLTPSKIRVDIPDFTPDGYERQRMRGRGMSVLEPQRLVPTPDDDHGERSLALRTRGSTPENTLCAITRGMTPRTTLTRTTIAGTTTPRTTTPRTTTSCTTTPVSPPPSSRYPTYRPTSERTAARNDLPAFLAPLRLPRYEATAPFYVPRLPSPSPFKLPPTTFVSAREIGSGSDSGLGVENTRQNRSTVRVRPKIPDFHALYDEQEMKRRVHFREPLLERREDMVRQTKSSRQPLSDTPLFEKGSQRDESLRELSTFHLHGATRDSVGFEPYSRGATITLGGSTPTPSTRVTTRDGSLEGLVDIPSGHLASGQSNTYSTTRHSRPDLTRRPATYIPQYPKPEAPFMKPLTRVARKPVPPDPSDPRDVHYIKANVAHSDAARRAGSQSLSFQPPSPTPANAGKPRPGWIMHVEELAKSPPISKDEVETELRVVDKPLPEVTHSTEDSRATSSARMPDAIFVGVTHSIGSDLEDSYGTFNMIARHYLRGLQSPVGPYPPDDTKPLELATSLEDELLTAVRTPLRRNSVHETDFV